MVMGPFPVTTGHERAPDNGEIPVDLSPLPPDNQGLVIFSPVERVIIIDASPVFLKVVEEILTGEGSAFLLNRHILPGKGVLLQIDQELFATDRYLPVGQNSIPLG